MSEHREVDHFRFGENWQRFLLSFDEERVRISQEHMLRLLRLPHLQGMVFMDIGCGSGIHSLAALYAGASRVISVDVDPDSVAATRDLWSRAGKPENWHILEGSVLDTAFVESLEKADIVYSWGVLMCTGDMWRAIRNSVIPLKPNGVYYIALYADEVYQDPSPEFWLDIKRRYNRGSAEDKESLEHWYAWERVLKGRAIAGENPFTIISSYLQSRGMEFWTDVRDWLGGYPCEFAKTRDVARLGHELGLEVLDVVAGEGNTEFILRPQGARNYWDELPFEEEVLAGPFASQDGACFAKRLSHLASLADNFNNHYRSPALLFEDGVLVGFPHAQHDHIRQLGEGRHSHWGDDSLLFFSASDNTDPNTNGRCYSIRLRRRA